MMNYPSQSRYLVVSWLFCWITATLVAPVASASITNNVFGVDGRSYSATHRATIRSKNKVSDSSSSTRLLEENSSTAAMIQNGLVQEGTIADDVCPPMEPTSNPNNVNEHSCAIDNNSYYDSSNKINNNKDAYCGYNYVFTGCTWLQLQCTPIEVCTCGADGTWLCSSREIFPCDFNGVDISPEGLNWGAECNPEDPLPQSSEVLVGDGDDDDDDNNEVDEDEDPNCIGECWNGDFCGTDGLCHLFSCDMWYQYGPVNFTGYDSVIDDDASSLEELLCETIPETFSDSSEEFSQMSVSFRCLATTPPPIAMGFNRKCSNTRGFTCYELDDDTDFTNFLSRVQSSKLECVPEEMPYENEVPNFHYPKNYETVNANGFSSTYVVAEPGTVEFDPDRAIGRALFSIYTEETETETKSPTTTIPPTLVVDTTPFSSASSISNIYFMVAVVNNIAGISLLAMFGLLL